jgi:hypothetical protein
MSLSPLNICVSQTVWMNPSLGAITLPSAPQQPSWLEEAVNRPLPTPESESTTVQGLIDRAWSWVPSFQILPGAAAMPLDIGDTEIGILTGQAHGMANALRSGANTRLAVVQTDIVAIQDLLTTYEGQRSTFCGDHAGSTSEFDAMCANIQTSLQTLQTTMASMFNQTTTSQNVVDSVFQRILSENGVTGDLVDVTTEYGVATSAGLGSCEPEDDIPSAFLTLEQAVQELLASAHSLNDNGETAVDSELATVAPLIAPAQTNVLDEATALQDFFIANFAGQPTEYYTLNSDANTWFNTINADLGTLGTKIQTVRDELNSLFDEYIDDTGTLGSFVTNVNQTLAATQELCVTLSEATAAPTPAPTAMPTPGPTPASTTTIMEAMATLAATLAMTTAAIEEVTNPKAEDEAQVTGFPVGLAIGITAGACTVLGVGIALIMNKRKKTAPAPLFAMEAATSPFATPSREYSDLTLGDESAYGNAGLNIVGLPAVPPSQYQLLTLAQEPAAPYDEAPIGGQGNPEEPSDVYDEAPVGGQANKGPYKMPPTLSGSESSSSEASDAGSDMDTDPTTEV